MEIHFLLVGRCRPGWILSRKLSLIPDAFIQIVLTWILNRFVFLGLFGNYVGFIVPQEVTPHLYSWEISLSLFLRSLFIIMTLIFSFSSSRKTQVYAFMYSLYAFRSCDIAINVQCIPGAKHLFYLNINQMFIYKHVLQFYKHTWYFKF